jgi:hypothetical protein
MDDRNEERRVEAVAEPNEGVTRRKLVYVAPLIMSRRLFYRASGCGKTNPGQLSCRGLSHAQGS